MDERLKNFFEYHSGLVEPWDGPAALVITNGSEIVAKLDRNGLRPMRHLVTCEDEIILASEAGTIEVPFEEIKESGRVKPGEVLYINLNEGRIYSKEEVDEKIVNKKPYKEWLAPKKTLKELEEGEVRYKRSQEKFVETLKLFGYTREDFIEIISSMANRQVEPLGSMGNDASLAVLSKKSKLLFNYFKQLFAQVTNPPIDLIREKNVMYLTTNIGVNGNILEDGLENGKLIKLDSPIITNSQLDKIYSLKDEKFKVGTLDVVFTKELGLEKTLAKLCEKAEALVKEGVKILVLSDRKATKNTLPIPSLLALSSLHHHLIKNRLRSNVDLIVESGEPREVMHFALLVGFGALAINPYVVLDSIKYYKEKELYLGKEANEEKYVKAIEKGLLKIISKMGIATIQSYRGAQIFEAVGLSSDLVNKYFKGTPSRIEGIGIDEIQKEVEERNLSENELLTNDGEYRWRKEGERHLFTPTAIYKLQQSTKVKDYNLFKEYSSEVNNQSESLATLRGLFNFKKIKKVDISEVEPASEIMKRFVTGAMSYGSLSKEAHEVLAIAMNKIGGKSNSGEGGEDPERFSTNRRSAIKQVASGRFGVTTEYLVNADELQIKMAQGAKPGEGGHLPGHKVTKEIARVRHTSPGIDLISPLPHHDIYSIEDLAQLIFDLKNVNEEARVSVKLVSEVGVGTIAAGVAKAHADMILISGHDGGTGASPLSSIKHAGLPWELAQQVLVLNNLRDRVRVQTDGQLKTGRDVVIAALLGAEEFGFATAPLVVLGCVMMRKCHTNNCPVGVATQCAELRKKFLGKSEYLVNFFNYIAEESREIMAELGVKSIDELVGKSELLEMNGAISHWKANGIDISNILHKPDVNFGSRCVKAQDHGIENILDRDLVEKAKSAIEHKKKVVINREVFNTDRTIGTLLSGKIAKKYGIEGLPEDTVKVNLIGVAGQSFGAFGISGVTLNLIGQGNDYVAKGLTGGKVIIRAPKDSKFEASKNIIAGNTCLYGGISGEVYLNGVAGERFAVRNSGATAVVEGIGDHGCEYMTGGRVVVLGETGKNFGAGMTGGIAYVFDGENKFSKRVNKEVVLLEKPDIEDEELIRELIEKHVEYTASEKGKEILENFRENLGKFIKVISPQYKELLIKRRCA